MLTPSRLTLARTRRGLSAAELARKAGVQARAIGEYERGLRSPQPATVESLAGALGFPAAFLTAPEPPRPQLVPRHAPEKVQATAAAQLAIEFNGWLERLFVLPQPDLPPPRTSPGKTRQGWRLDLGPAPNMVQLLESHGVRVFSLPVDCAEQAAFSCWHNGTPYVFLNPTATPEQARFDAAVQLAVLVGHDEPHGFAAEFLMPQKQLHGTDHRHWHVAREQFALKANLDSPAPGGMTRRETSRLLTKVFKVLRENGTTPLHVAKELNLGLEELNGLVFGLVLTALPGGGEPGPRGRARLTLVH
ncbi:Transcriptional regulator, contains XRE-family HTH domain [Lentzea xinjiangensis]|uniref:Transcriptional regulator, contains XRE-family HTH domain n=1 Tax=Lentzea xinjiangensis TaxID=402600 RepID=A0A1H9N454_9PSEU|nr:XRE family transcriptional regulator [Lentzea xinjiangensis]SER30704.1 Transcriptional regulator, contains XRE-family HTH domain [Lentzea xinjiangensis]